MLIIESEKLTINTLKIWMNRVCIKLAGYLTQNCLEEDEIEDEHDHETTSILTTSTHFNKDQIFEQGETRDFLQFLRRIKYDHSKLPYLEDDREPVTILVSIVVSNIRAVSEVTMVNFPHFMQKSNLLVF